MRDIKFRGQYCRGIENAGCWVHWDINGTDVIDCIDGDTIGQYTGLKDKNGVDIYEGDIIRFGALALNDTVKFGPMSWDSLPEGVDENDISTELGIKFIGGDIDDWASVKRLVKDNPDVIGVEVIGNIHENPELLEPNQ